MFGVFNLLLPKESHALKAVIAHHGPHRVGIGAREGYAAGLLQGQYPVVLEQYDRLRGQFVSRFARSEEHTSELQSRQYLVCRLLLEKKTTTLRHNIRT